jgi:hypothetical protein
VVSHFTRPRILARIPVTSVNFVLAILAVITGRTAAFVVEDVLLATRGTILAGIRVTGIALDQHFLSRSFYSKQVNMNANLN